MRPRVLLTERPVALALLQVDLALALVLRRVAVARVRSVDLQDVRLLIVIVVLTEVPLVVILVSLVARLPVLIVPVSLAAVRVVIFLPGSWAR